MTAAALAREIEARARSLGFDRVGAARVERIDRDAEALDLWLERGRHASMRWMERTREARKSPEALLPGCRSVVSVAMNYWPGGEAARTPDGRARVALYARGSDYHEVLGSRLERLAAWIEERSGRPARACVDTEPVLERAWAERAGVGWIGKNANLITRAFGSWVLLGEVLASVEIEPSPGPHEDFCGRCTACIDACPTGAIVAPGVVDSERCVSYWTIEHRGAIPAERRSGNGAWIFGCDECQTVCPWNLSFSVKRAGDPFAIREDLRGLDPAAVLGMDEAEFRSRFSGTPILRARCHGMRRNALIVLANTRSPGALQALERASLDADPIVRDHAAWALDRLA